jgi:Spy/CpxP family protein refolding chaperone
LASSRGPVRSETCNAGRAYPACNTFYTRCRKAIILEDTWDEVLGYLRKKHHDRTKPSHSKVIKQPNHKKPTMRKVMMTMVVLLLTVTIATAQRGHRQGSNDFLSELKLTTEQQAQIKAIKQEGRAQMREIHKQSPDQRPDYEAMKKMHETSKAKVDAILTPEQRKQLIATQAERKAIWKNVDKKAIQADLKAHNVARIEPVISAARAQFDQFISAEDKSSLDRLRPVFAAKPKGKTSRGKGKKPSEADVAAKKATMETWKTDYASEISELKAITKKYAADLERIQERMMPQRRQWAQERRDIISRQRPEGAEKAQDVKAEAYEKKAGKSLRKSRENNKSREDWPRGAAFLLIKG